MVNSSKLRFLNPLRWLYLVVYLFGPFLFYMAKANIDVAYRVITGRINPGIVKIKTGLVTDIGITMLANSITLTPGTLTVDIDPKTNDLYIHWINVKRDDPSPEDVCGSMLKWVRRIVE
ncbi:MAG: Na+/H+ antiporter subunit E [Candidatus Woesearchaeota archaeon]